MLRRCRQYGPGLNLQRTLSRVWRGAVCHLVIYLFAFVSIDDDNSWFVFTGGRANLEVLLG